MGRAPKSESLFIDNNILVAMDRKLIGTKSARKFAKRNRGDLFIAEQTRAEFLGSGFGSLIRRAQLLRYRVRTAPLEASDVDSVISSLNKGTSFQDAAAFAAAKKYGSGLVTGDRGLFNSAFRQRDGLSALRFRNFEGDSIRGYERARNMIRSTAKDTDPHQFTGSAR